MTFHEVAVCGFNNNVTLLKDKQHNKINGIRTSGNSWHYGSELFFLAPFRKVYSKTVHVFCTIFSFWIFMAWYV